MSRFKKSVVPIAAPLVGLGFVSLFFLMSSPQWGAPGTEAYRIYEARNRLLPVSMMLIAIGLVAVYLPLRTVLGSLGRLGFVVSLIGVALMLAGNIAEFWLFSDQPYGQVNPRAMAWSSFLFGALLLVVGLTIFVVSVARRKQVPSGPVSSSPAP